MNKINNSEDFFYYKKREKSREQYKKIEDILVEWYGYKRGKSEVNAYLPKTVLMADVLKDYLQHKISKDENLFKLKNAWKSLLGEDISRVCRPVSFKGNVVIIEVDNSIWLMELKTYYYNVIEGKINNLFKLNNKLKIVFVPTRK